MTYKDIFYRNAELDILSPTREEDAAEAVSTAADEELETAAREALTDYYRILEDIAILEEHIREKYKLIRANNNIDNIIKAEQERRERSANNE